jgi:hypothetical protein
LIILDVVMPLRDGFSATREIKRVLPNIPVLLFSTSGDKETLAESKLAGAQGFVSKFDLSFKLLKAVDALIQGDTFFPDGIHSGWGAFDGTCFLSLTLCPRGSQELRVWVDSHGSVPLIFDWFSRIKELDILTVFEFQPTISLWQAFSLSV